MNTKYHIVYAHINKINGKVYVGQTSLKPEQRWGNNGSNYSKQPRFYRAILKYGWNNFQHIILETHIPHNKIIERENYWINYYNSLNPLYGYNLIEAGYKPKTSIYKKKNNYQWTPERKQQASIRMKERWETDINYAQKMRDNAKNILDKVRPNMKGSNNPMYGKHRYGEEAARKQKVQCVNTGMIFSTIKDAALWIGNINQKSHISAVCKGKRKTAGKHPITGEPLEWRYIL